MKNTEIEIITLSIRLLLKNQLADYYPFIQEPEVRHQFLTRLYTILEDSPYLLDIKQHLNEIILIISTQNIEIYDFLSTFPKHIKQIINDCNTYGQEQHWSHTINAVMAFDAGLSIPLELSFKNRAFPIINWTGLHLDRVSTLTKEMVSNNHYPTLLITHAFYKRLPSPLQENFSTLYYIRHICCYSMKKE